MDPMGLSLGPIPSPDGDGGGGVNAWYGNIQYLLNISSIGSICCVIIFLSIKLRSDHRQIPSPTALFTKLLALWHATCRKIARHCGSDPTQFLLIEGRSFAVLSFIALLSIFLILPINLYASTASLNDGQFFKTTINHIAKGSPLLWIHFLFVVIIVVLVHFVGVVKPRSVPTAKPHLYLSPILLKFML